MKIRQDVAEEKMLKQFNNLIMKLSSNYCKNYNGKYALEDLVQEAKLGALKAFRSFDPSKNVKMITHIHNYINFYLSHYVRADTGIIKIPKSTPNDNKIIPEIVDCELYQENFLNERCSRSSNLQKSIENKIMYEKYMEILNDKEREILNLIFVKGLTYKEVAKLHGTSRQFANTTANKALNKIKEQFKNQF